MKRVLLCTLLVVLVKMSAFGQDKPDSRQNSMQVFFGPSFHGTDNVLGIAFFAEYSHFFNRKLAYCAFLGTTINDGLADIIFVNRGGQIEDGRVNFTTAGLQGGVSLSFNFFQNRHHQLQGSLGALLRYQTTSNPKIIGLYISYPYTDIEFPARSISFGGVATISYNYILLNNAFIGAKAWLQYDSNDDTLSVFSLVVGKKF